MQCSREQRGICDRKKTEGDMNPKNLFYMNFFESVLVGEKAQEIEILSNCQIEQEIRHDYEIITFGLKYSN